MILRGLMNIDNKSILIINPFGIGDVLFATSLINNIKQEAKNVSLGFLCGPRSESILKHNPHLDSVIVYNRDYLAGFKRNIFLYARKYNEFIRKIKQRKFDIALDLSLNTAFGFFCWAAGIKRRIGFDYKKRGRFLTEKIYLNGYKNKHVTEYYAEVLGFLGLKYKKHPFPVYLSDEDEKFGKRFFEENDLLGKVVIGISPAGGDSWGEDSYRKHWPQEKFSRLIEKIAKEFSVKIIIFGSKSEAGITDRVIKEVSTSVIKAVGLDILKYLAVLKRVNLLVCNDGGPLHLAKAMGVKTISIFGPVDPKVYGPYPFDENRDIIIKKNFSCQPCYNNFRLPECPHGRKCLKDITVEEVFQSAKHLLVNTFAVETPTRWP